MLALNRWIGEEIVIILPGYHPLDPAGHVVVQVVETTHRGVQVKLGVQAPKTVQVYRREVLEKPDFKAQVVA